MFGLSRRIWLALHVALLIGLLPTPLRTPDAALAQTNDFLPLTRSYHFAHVTTDDGLPTNDVEVLLQDSRGFVWIGTQDGLSRFDGYRLQTFRNRADDPASLAGNYVMSLLEAEDGAIWAALRYGGVSRFDPASETFASFSFPNEGRGQGDELFTAFQDSRGDLWFGGYPRSGLIRYDPTTGTHHRFPVNEIHAGEADRAPAVWQIAEDAQGTLWMAADTVLIEYDPVRNAFSAHRVPYPDEHRLAALVSAGDGAWWVGGSNGLYHFDGETGAFTRLQSGFFVNKVALDRHGHLWITTHDGVRVYAPEVDQFVEWFRSDPLNPHSLLSDYSTGLLIDNEGVIWLGSNRGVNRFAPAQSAFATYQHDPEDPHALAAPTVAAIHGNEADGTLWLAADRTLTRVERTSGRVEHMALPTGPDGLARMGALYQDRSGVLWVGMDGRTLLRLDPATGEVSPFELPSDEPAVRAAPPSDELPPPVQMPEIVAITEDGRGNLWVAIAYDALYRIDAARQTITVFRGIRSTRPDPQRPLSDVISTLATDPNGDLWVGYRNDRISRYDPEQNAFVHYRYMSETPAGIPSIWLQQIHFDRRGVAWLATYDGLYRFDPQTEKGQYYGEQTGFPVSRLMSIVEDEAGALWLGTEQGLMRFDPRDESAALYGTNDFLAPGAWVNGAAWSDESGMLFFGGDAGLLALAPERIGAVEARPPVVLTDLQLFNQSVPIGPESVLTQPLWETDALTFDHTDSVISLAFAALNYAAPDAMLYRYRLDGLEDDWNSVDSQRRFATYTSLPAGNYTFLAQARVPRGAWGESTTLRVTVLPPWWQTWWARVGALLGIWVVTALVVYLRVRSVRNTNRQLQQQVDERTASLLERTEQLTEANQQLEVAHAQAQAASNAKSQFLATMSHELRTPLNGIMGYAQILGRHPNLETGQQDGLRTIYNSGRHLLTLINDILDLAKIEAGKLELDQQAVHLPHLLDDVAELMRMSAQQKGLGFSYRADPMLPPYVRADSKRLRQVLLNLLGNAVKFTNEGTVTFHIQQLDPNAAPGCERTHTTASGSPEQIPLHIEISDTGCGIAPEELETIFRPFEQGATGRRQFESTGLGLSISQQIVQQMGGEIRVASQPGQGSTFHFTITLPLASDAVSAHTHNPIVHGYRGERRTILVVDDRLENRQLLLDMLEPLGFHVVLAENGLQAVQIVQEKVAQEMPLHAILIDLVMPVMMGFEAVQQIRSLPEMETLPIIAVSASALDMAHTEARQIGCDDFLVKPVNTERLLNALQAHLHLEWIYMNAGEDGGTEQRQPLAVHGTPGEKTNGPSSQWSIPPSAELETLFEFAYIGNMARVIAHARRLAEDAPEYSAFAQEIIALAEQFDDEAIQALLKEYLALA